MFFKICKYAFILILEKRMSNKTAPGFVRFVSMIFLIFEKGDKQKIVPGFCRFVIIIWLFFSVKGGYRDVWGLYVCFL